MNLRCQFADYFVQVGRRFWEWGVRSEGWLLGVDVEEEMLSFGAW